MSSAKAKPTSFRLLPSVLTCLKGGAERYGMTKTRWLEFLLTAAVGSSPSNVARDGFELTISPKRR